MEFLCKVLGQSDRWDLTAPALLEATEESREPEVRKNATIAALEIVGRARERQQSLDFAAVRQRWSAMTLGNTVLFRHLGTAGLGLLGDPESVARLQELLNDPDQKVQINAAIGRIRAYLRSGKDSVLEVL